jgi:LPXTG-motif cell wall-anchored protein
MASWDDILNMSSDLSTLTENLGEAVIVGDTVYQKVTGDTQQQTTQPTATTQPTTTTYQPGFSTTTTQPAASSNTNLYIILGISAITLIGLTILLTRKK